MLPFTFSPELTTRLCVVKQLLHVRMSEAIRLHLLLTSEAFVQCLEIKGFTEMTSKMTYARSS